jgi:hypothetical protein
MAKAKNLAGLAALGALGYMLTRGDKGDAKKSDTAAAPEESRRQITDYMKKAPAEPREAAIAAANDVRTSRVSPAAVKDNTTNIRMPSGSPDAEAGMTRGTRAADARDAEAGMSRGTRSTSTAGAGRGTVNPSSVTASDARAAEAGMSRGSRATSMAGAGRGSVNPAAVKPSGARDLEAGMSRGRREMSPGPGQSTVDAVRGLQSAAKVPSSMAGRPGYDEAGRRLPSNAGMPGYDEAGNPMKKGGAVKKMASGGMTASKRADGIASRGKTKCKMY